MGACLYRVEQADAVVGHADKLVAVGLASAQL